MRTSKFPAEDGSFQKTFAAKLLLHASSLGSFFSLRLKDGRTFRSVIPGVPVRVTMLDWGRNDNLCIRIGHSRLRLVLTKILCVPYPLAYINTNTPPAPTPAHSGSLPPDSWVSNSHIFGFVSSRMSNPPCIGGPIPG
jgi:hypothetical protein